MEDSVKQNNIGIVGLVDADLLAKGTRHPNLALLKIAGFLYDNCIDFELILDNRADISKYSHIFLSRVFTFTKLPDFYEKIKGTPNEAKFHLGGTGFYVTEKDIKKFSKERNEDMHRLENDPFLMTLPNKTDLVCLCSNCHRMIHRRRDSILRIEELRSLISIK